MEKLTWIKTLSKEFKYKNLVCKEIDLSISYDEIEDKPMEYSIIYKGGLSCILWKDRHIIKGE